jgi:hypothetical protein
MRNYYQNYVTSKIVKRFSPIEGWPWRVIENTHESGIFFTVEAKADNKRGWYEYPDEFETVEEAEVFAAREAKECEMDAYLSKSSGGLL